MTKHEDGVPRAERGSARRLTRHDFLKVWGGAMVGASCGSLPLACAGRWRVSSGAGSGGEAGRETADLWYEDNNMGTVGGMPPDFKEKFYRPDLWAGAREAIDVYYVRATTLLNPENDLDDSFLEENFVPVLEESGVEIALDAVGPTSSTLDRRQRTSG